MRVKIIAPAKTTPRISCHNRCFFPKVNTKTHTNIKAIKTCDVALL